METGNAVLSYDASHRSKEEVVVVVVVVLLLHFLLHFRLRKKHFEDFSPKRRNVLLTTTFAKTFNVRRRHDDVEVR